MKQPNDLVYRRDVIRAFQKPQYHYGGSIYNIIRDVPSASSYISMSVIEDIKNDIEEYRNHILDEGADDMAYGEMSAIDYVLNVIDKHISAEESEGK